MDIPGFEVMYCHLFLVWLKKI